jgi:hypothetical protein
VSAPSALPPIDPAVEAALKAAWAGQCLDFPRAAVILARAFEQQRVQLQEVTAQRDTLTGIASERVTLWSAVEMLRRRLVEAENRIAKQDEVIARAVAVYRGKAGVHTGIISRRAARHILQGGV